MHEDVWVIIVKYEGIDYNEYEKFYTLKEAYQHAVNLKDSFNHMMVIYRNTYHGRSKKDTVYRREDLNEIGEHLMLEELKK